VRTAASEDAHVVACFFGLIALMAADASRRAGAFTAPRLAVMIAAGLLSFYGRQSMFFWPPLVALVACWGRVRELARRPVAWCVAALLLLAATPKVLVLLYGSEESYRLLLMLTVPMLSPKLMAHHPLLRLGESGALLLSLAGVATVLFRKRDATLAWLASGALFAFVSSLGMSAQPGYGLEYGFRLPMFALLLPLAGVGAVQWIDGIGAASSSIRRLATVMLLGALALFPVPALVLVLSEPSPLAQEYRLITQGAHALPHDRSADVSAQVGPTSELKVPHSAFGRDFRVVDSPKQGEAGARYAYQGLGCFCYPIKELVDPAGPPFNARAAAMSLTDLRGFLAALWDDPTDAIHRLGGEPRTGQMRAECEAAFRGAARFIPWGEVEIGRQEPLDRYFTRQRVPIGVWELSPMPPPAVPARP